MIEKEPRLCKDCPRISLLKLVRNVSWTNTPAEDTVVKLCAKMRAYKDTNLPCCPHFPRSETLDNFEEAKKEEKELSRLRQELAALESKLNILTKGEFFSGFAVRGLETYKVREVETLLLKYPEIIDVLRQAIAKHIEFYQKLYGNTIEAIVELQPDDCATNILQLHRHFPPAFSLSKFARMKR